MSIGSQKSDAKEHVRATIEIHANALISGIGFMGIQFAGSADHASEDANDSRSKHGESDDFQSVTHGCCVSNDRGWGQLGSGWLTSTECQEHPGCRNDEKNFDRADHDGMDGDGG